MDFGQLLSPDERQSDGVFVLHGDSDTEYRVASMRQKAYQDFVAARYQAARRGRRDIPQDVANRIMVEGMLRFILKDWRPRGPKSWLRNKDGSPVPFSKENARKLLEATSDDAASVRDFIVEEAQNSYNFTAASEDGIDEPESATPADALKSGDQVEPAVGPGAGIPAGQG